MQYDLHVHHLYTSMQLTCKCKLQWKSFSIEERAECRDQPFQNTDKFDTTLFIVMTYGTCPQLGTLTGGLSASFGMRWILTMAGRPSSSPRPLGNHNRQWIGGQHAVVEALRAGRWLPLELACSTSAPDEEFAESLTLATAMGVPVLRVDNAALSRLCRGDDHQGLAMRLPEYPYGQLDDLLGTVPRPTAMLLLDRIQDSHNFGAILRSAEVFGFDGVVVAEKGQSPVNAQVIRSSAGAIHHLLLARVPRMEEAIAAIKQSGCRVYGAAPEGAVIAGRADLSRPSAILIGNEAMGIAADLLSQCDERIRIPQFGETGSLNAAVSAGILCYELRRQRDAGSTRRA